MMLTNFPHGAFSARRALCCGEFERLANLANIVKEEANEGRIRKSSAQGPT